MERDARFGASIGGYVLGERVGQGGMGVVYAASAPDGTPVAVKLLLDDLAADPLFRERFIREAEQVPTIEHPHIVPIFDFGEDQGSLFLAMELIEGPDLKALIREAGSLDIHRTKQLIFQVASALDAAHEAGLVHRDVKAQNILVRDWDEDLHAYITDFGLMKPLATETSISRTGQVFGSVPYMAPELIEGLASDGRADVYALGCVLYECLTGSVPFVRANEVAMLWAHINEDPPRLSALRQGLPGGVDDVVIRALQKHPEDRYLTCGELYEDLIDGLRRRKSVMIPSKTRLLVERARRRSGPRGVWGPNFFPELARVERAQQQLDWRKAALIAVTFAAPLASFAHVASPDGLPAAVSDAVSTGSEFLAEQLGIDKDDGDLSETVAKDDERQRRSRGSEGRGHIPAAAGEANGSVSSDDPASPTGSGKSSDEAKAAQTVLSGRVAYSGDHGQSDDFDVYMFDNGERIRLTSTPDDDWDVEWSPRGDRISFTRCPPSGAANACEIFVMRPDGSDIKQLTDSSTLGDSQAAWSPDGSRIAFRRAAPGTTNDGEIWVMRADGSGARQLTTTPGDNLQMHPTWAPGGKSIAFAADGDIWIVGSYGSRLRRVVGGNSIEQHPTWSPVGGAIAFGSDRGGTDFDVWIFELRTGNLRNLSQGVDSALDESWPVWAPDGSRIAFILGPYRLGGYQADVYTVRPDGTGRTPVFTGTGSSEVDPTWETI